MRKRSSTTVAFCGLLLCSALHLDSAPARSQEAISRAHASDARPRLVVQLGHSSTVDSVAISPDGRLVLSASADHTARLWEAATGAELRRFAGHSLDVRSAAFSPDGRYVLTGSADTSVRLWDAATGAELHRFTNLGPVTSVSVSPDGRFAVAGSYDHAVRRLDLSTGREVDPPLDASDRVSSVAYAADGRFLAAASADGSARTWDARTGTLLHVFTGHTGPVQSVAISPDGRFVLTGGQDRTARLWDAATGAELRRFTGHARDVRSVAFTPDGRFALTAANDAVVAWDTQTGVEAGRFEGQQNAECVAISADGRFVVTGGASGSVVLWNAASRQPMRAFDGSAVPMRSLAFSPDGRFFVTGGDDGARVWSTATGAEAGRLAELSTRATSVEVSPDGRFVLANAIDNTLGLWDAATGAKLRELEPAPAVFSPDGRYVLTGSTSREDTAAHLWETATGKQIRRFTGHTDQVATVVFSPDGRFVLTSSTDMTVRLWNAATGASVHRLEGSTTLLGGAAFSPDGRLVVTAGFDNTVRLWDTTTGAELRRFAEGPHPDGVVASRFVQAVAFSPDGRYVLTSAAGGARLWDAATGAEAVRFEGHTEHVSAVAFSPDGRFVLTGSFDATTRLWDRATGRELAELVSFRDGTWAVVDPEGRFDTNDLDEIEGLSWVAPDDPFRALPVEIFTRDYYEPRLLARILAGDRFEPVRPVADLDRAQPQVRIVEVRIGPEAPDRATIRVEVAGTSVASRTGGRAVTRQSGAYDLRLFRDGQLVGVAPRRDEVPTSRNAAGDDLLAWRREKAIDLDRATGTVVVTFENVHLGRGAEERVVQFSAYAFNEDRVKSATAREARRLKPATAPGKGRAYLVVIGANAYETSRLNLEFAANDARGIEAALSAKLEQSGDFEEVVPIELVSDYATRGEQRVVTEALATKRNIKVVLDLLEGKAVDAAVVATIPNASRLRQATPSDAVLISFSGHGYADRAGRFFLVPYDTGEVPAGEPTAALLERFVSSDELGDWLRDVDAGDMALIVDACQSAAAVEGEGFKPGPMGSRGLGQLAYDKGMWVLAATQAEDIALESKLVRQGLLSYALTREGIEAGLADFRPKDGTILLSEWLAYGAERVPSLFDEVRRERVASLDSHGPRLVGAGADRARLLEHERPDARRVNRAQQPALFDFSRKRRDVALVRLQRRT